MSDPSKSPERNTFRIEGVVKRAREKGLDPSSDPDTIGMIDFYKLWEQRDQENLVDPEWQKDNLEYDLRTTDWILEKVRASEVYAQNLYAVMCNNDFIKNDVWPVLTEQKWRCSWRHAGGIIADMLQRGDYIDWYCSGMGDADGYVPEGTITMEIEQDLLKLGWLVHEYTE